MHGILKIGIDCKIAIPRRPIIYFRIKLLLQSGLLDWVGEDIMDVAENAARNFRVFTNPFGHEVADGRKHSLALPLLKLGLGDIDALDFQFPLQHICKVHLEWWVGKR